MRSLGATRGTIDLNRAVTGKNVGRPAESSGWESASKAFGPSLPRVRSRRREAVSRGDFGLQPGTEIAYAATRHEMAPHPV